jgi:hypothetical protein
MFSQKSCYFFVRPKKSFLEVVFFLGRPVRAPQIRRADRTSATKIAHFVRLTHRDEVEAPITDWLKEAYGFAERQETKDTKETKEAKAKRAKAAKTKTLVAKRRRRVSARRPRA